MGICIRMGTRERIALPRQMEPVGGNVALADGDSICWLGVGVTGVVYLPLVDCAVLDQDDERS